jgi:hypothetical protein
MMRSTSFVILKLEAAGSVMRKNVSAPPRKANCSGRLLRPSAIMLSMVIEG